MLQLMERCIVKNSKYENHLWKNSAEGEVFLYMFASMASVAFLNTVWYSVYIVANCQSEQDLLLQNGGGGGGE